MLQSWKLGRVFGIDLFVHWSFLLVPLLVMAQSLQAGSLELMPYTLTLVLSLFGCVVLHELGHALAARRFGIPTRDITLYPIGGVARLARMSERPGEEFWISVAGPAVNVVIAAVLWPLIGQVPLGRHGELLLPSGHLLFDLMVLNLGLVVFNMLPVFPSDGGRVLRAFLATFLDRVRATEIAVWIGAALAVLLGLYGLMEGALTTVAVAAFLVFAGQQELAAVRARRDALEVEPLIVEPAWDAPRPTSVVAFTGVLWDPRLRGWVIWRDGRPVGLMQ